MADKKDVLGDLNMLVSNDNVWCFMLNDGTPAYYSDRKVMEIIAEKYKQELKHTDKQFDSDELTARIISVRKRSNDLKSKIREQEIPKLENEIADLQRKISKGQNQTTDVSGCWVIFIPEHKNTIVNIRGNDYGYVFGNIHRLHYRWQHQVPQTGYWYRFFYNHALRFHSVFKWV